MTALDAPTRIQLRNVLCTTDFSEPATAAIPYATALAKHYGANLHVLHVRSLAVNALAPPETWNDLRRTAEILVEQDKSRLCDAFPGLQPHALVGEGDLWTNVAVAINENNVDLVVIGTRGRSGIVKLLLGSAAEEIFRKAPCPVLTVGPYATVEPKPTGEFTRILFATDFSPQSVAAAPYAISLAQEYQAQLTLLHVLAEPEVGDLVQASEVAPACAQLLHNLVPREAESWCVPDCLVERGPVAEKILETAAHRGADLIVLGVRSSSVFPAADTHLPMATAHKVVSRAPCPVLTVRV